MEKSF